MLSSGEADVVRRVCDLLVPGSAAISPDRYLAALMPSLPPAEEDAVRAAIGVLAGVAGEATLARLSSSARPLGCAKRASS